MINIMPKSKLEPGALEAPYIERRATGRIFRERLKKAMKQSNFNASQLAAKIGIDRSTLSQILSEDLDRMPRADTIGAIAVSLKVSLDWLLGITQDEKIAADILHESIQITPQSPLSVEEGMARWHAEAVGYKIRYVPSSLPDLCKTEEVLEYEFENYVARTTGQAQIQSRNKLSYTRLPETDMEVCFPLQAIEGFALGEGIWRGLPEDARIRQLEHMRDIADELYPRLRLFLFDGLSHFAAPYTIFGPIRAAIYIGQAYLVFTTTDHIRLLTRHFDQLIRAAVVQASDFSGYIDQQLVTLTGKPSKGRALD